jgi:hypothetical protein
MRLLYIMSLIGFKMPNDVDDLTAMFVPIGVGPMYATPTGFIDPNTGKDLREIFAVNTTYTIPDDTKLIAQNGIDLRYIFQGIVPVPVVTIGGTGTYTQEITGNKYTYTFTNSTTTTTTNTISINKNISSLYAIVVGGGGSGSNGNASLIGSGGGGGGFGYVSFSYVMNNTYDISVGGIGQSSAGGTSFFRNLTGSGVTSSGGKMGTTGSAIRALSGTCTNNGPGTFVSRAGGSGGVIGGVVNGNNSSGSITVLAVTYNFGGGGRTGTGTVSDPNNKGGNAGLNGIGGTTLTSSGAGGAATTPGSGGGGGARYTSGVGGAGGPGLVIVTFTYP